ncbi:MAG: immunoglobulin domain-containing protein, partial [Verrucomicrobiota bacterium]
MKTQKQIIRPLRWLTLALSTLALALPAAAQLPTPDSFNPGANDQVNSLAVQADGKILVGGSFATLGGQSRNCIGRLNADGTLDTSFNPGANDRVNSLAVQADGKILVGGYFDKLGGQSRNCIGRLNADGTLDTSFNLGANYWVYSLSAQSDGKILVGGSFTTLGGQSRNFIGRLNADGTLDTSFDPGASYTVASLVVQADQKILVGGGFTTLGGESRTNIGRLNADGTLDPSFNPGANGWVYSLAVQTDGKILVGGYLSTLGGKSRTNIGRLNADGTLDPSFNPGANDWVDSLAVQADGKILVGGYFTTLGGQSRTSIGRLNNTGPATQNLTYDGSTIAWTRGGSSPEVWRTTFEHSANATDWTSLGAGTRIAGGWQLTGLSLLPNGIMRARGYVTGGFCNGSGWFVETMTMIGAPVIITQPASRTHNVSTTATFSVVAYSTPPLSYQWRKDGVILNDGGNVSGTTAATLVLDAVLRSDAGNYSVVISNASGSVTSAVATLTVLDPAITAQPLSTARDAGESVTFSVTAVGTAPLNYEWWQEGVALAGATGASLILTNLQGSDAGNYLVVITNAYGAVTSAVAVLTVNPTSFNPGANGGVSSLAVQADGKILVGGYFTTLVRQSRNYIARLNADGTLDPSFNPGASGGDYYAYVSSLAVQADGKILLGGRFTTLGGQSRTNIGRLKADGTLDPSFNPGASGGD